MAGEKRAWDRFVAALAPVIYAAVGKKLRPGGHGEEIDDVAQEVFVKLCRHDFKLLRGFDPERAKLTTFLTVIATTTAIDHLRRQKAQRSGQHQALDDVPEAALSVAPVTPEHIEIPDGLLSPRQALVMQLLYARDMEGPEAAELLGISAQTVRSLHHKALLRLRAHFKEEESDFMGDDSPPGGVEHTKDIKP
ncbi:MAG: sigma-70 family RNA polymerase sigma factor [Rhodovibrionaceae bacterium]